MFFIFKLAFFNVLRRNTQSILTIIITAVTVATLLMTIVIMNVLNAGIEESEKRLGADIMLIPTKSNLDTRTFLYSGESTNIYINKNDLKFLKDYPEIDKMTEEFFTHTLSAGCCTVNEKLRIVGINRETDFLIKPWIEEQNMDDLSINEVIIGADVALPLGTKMGLLGKPFTLKGSLYKTGTGMDRTLFLDIDVTRKLAVDKMQESIFHGEDPNDLITALFIKLKPNSDIKAVTDRINSEQDVAIATSKAETITKLEDSLKGWYMVLVFIISIVLLNSILSLFGRFNFLMKKRKGEIGYLRAIGVSKQKIFASLIFEIFIIAMIGGVLGSVLVLLVINNVLALVAEQFLTPKTTVTIYQIIKIFVYGPILAFLVGIVSSILPFYNSANMEPREAMAKGVK